MSVAPCFRSLPSSGTSRAAAGARRMQCPTAAASEPSENPVCQTQPVWGLTSAVRQKKNDSARAVCTQMRELLLWTSEDCDAVFLR